MLTRREYDILCLLAEGLSGKEVARRLRLAHSTVRNILSTGLYVKLGVSNMHGAVARGLVEGIITMEDLR